MLYDEGHIPKYTSLGAVHRLGLASCVLILSMCSSGCHDVISDADRESLCDAPKPARTSTLDGATASASSPIPALPVAPSVQQLRWQRGEMYLFVHFGMNTFTGNEWGDGNESPVLFDPADVDAEQWVRVARTAGFKGLILTAKHHDGFALWPTAYSDHSVARSPWRDGRGDVVQIAADAARRADLPFGVYFPLWDRHEPTYGTPAYNEFFVGQLEELLTGYGPLFEVWLDGAHGQGFSSPYDLTQYYEVIRRLQPDALIANVGPDIRWVGNEIGVAPVTQFSPVDGARWHPVECPLPNRTGWFWRAEESSSVKSARQLVSIYFNCVGHNGVMLLNVPANRQGRFPAADVKSLYEFRAALDLIFETNLALGGRATASDVRDAEFSWSGQHAIDGNDETFWAANDGATNPHLEVELDGCVAFNTIALKEPIQYGQRINGYRVDGWVGGRWITLSRGSSIGYKKLDTIDPVATSRVRLVIESSEGNPAIQELGLYDNPFAIETVSLSQR